MCHYLAIWCQFHRLQNQKRFGFDCFVKLKYSIKLLLKQYNCETYYFVRFRQQPHASLLKASTGLMFAAFIAGNTPKAKPTAAEKPVPMSGA